MSGAGTGERRSEFDAPATAATPATVGTPATLGAPREASDPRKDHMELHALAARTHNVVTTLAVSLKEVVQRQQRYERGLNLNSFVAYVVFTVLLGGGFYQLYRSRADRLVGDRDQAIRARESAAAEAAQLRSQLEARDRAELAALDFWQLLRAGKKSEAIARYPELAALRLTKVESQVFQAELDRARREVVDGGWEGGLEAFEKKQWKNAAAAFKRSLSFEAEGPKAAQLRYYYGVSLHKQGDYAEAARQLEQAITGGVERTVGPDARFYLGAAFEQLRQPERARAEYERYATARPDDAFSPSARRKVRELGGRTMRRR